MAEEEDAAELFEEKIDLLTSRLADQFSESERLNADIQQAIRGLGYGR